MAYIHTVRYLRVSPKKLKQVGKLVRGMRPAEAIKQLDLQPQKGAKFLSKAIASAVNNAAQTGIKLEQQTIVGVAAQRGPVFMRRWIKPKGRSTPKRKPTSHADIVFNDVKPTVKKEVTKTKATEKVQEDK